MATTNTGICVLLWTEIGSTNSGEPSISPLLAEFPGLLPLMGYNRRQAIKADSRDAARIVGTTIDTRVYGTTNHGAYHYVSLSWGGSPTWRIATVAMFLVTFADVIARGLFHPNVIGRAAARTLCAFDLMMTS